MEGLTDGARKWRHERMTRVRARMGELGVDALLLSHGADLPWLTGYRAMPLERLTMLVLPLEGDPVLVVPALEAPRVRGAGDLSLITTVIKLVPLFAVLGLAMWLWLGGTPMVAQTPVPITGGRIAAAAGLCFWAFLGIESATVPADKVENASRVVPMATMVGTVLAGVIFLGISLAFQGYMPIAAAAASPAPVAAFLGRHFGGAIGGTVAVFAAISAFGALNGFILLQGEMPWAMARGGVFPMWFAVESVAGTPVRAHLVSSLLMSAVMLLNFGRGMGDLFQFVASVSLAAGMLSYAMTMFAAIRLLPEERLLIPVALFAAAFTGWATWGLGIEAMSYAGGLLLIGLPIYWAVRRNRGLNPAAA